MKKSRIRSHQSRVVSRDPHSATTTVKGVSVSGHPYEIEIPGFVGLRWFQALSRNKYERWHQNTNPDKI